VPRSRACDRRTRRRARRSGRRPGQGGGFRAWDALTEERSDLRVERIPRYAAVPFSILRTSCARRERIRRGSGRERVPACAGRRPSLSRPACASPASRGSVGSSMPAGASCRRVGRGSRSRSRSAADLSSPRHRSATRGASGGGHSRCGTPRGDAHRPGGSSRRAGARPFAASRAPALLRVGVPVRTRRAGDGGDVSGRR
jgi:hypothetical protein